MIKPINKNAITIVFAPDNYYCKYFSVALKSLIDNAASDRFYDIIILATDISDRNKRLLRGMLPKNFSLRFFDVSDLAKDYPIIVKNHWSSNAYYRLFIPMLMPDYEKVLYLDSDICIRDSLAGLFDMNFDGCELIAVKDADAPLFYKDTRRIDQIRNTLKMKHPENYFNSGMTFLNLKNLDKNKYSENLSQACREKILFFPDQDILNSIFENTVKLVNCKWNFQYHIPMYHPDYLDIITGEEKEEYVSASQNPCIIHYTSSIKPWSYPKEELAEYFWEYARKSPFYEEILYENLVTKNSLKLFWQRNKIRLTLAKCNLFSKISTGAKRLHYQAKAVRYGRMLKEIQKLK